MTETNSGSLKIEIGKSYRTVVEYNEAVVNKSIFKGAYEKAFQLVNEIHNQGNDFHSNNKDCKTSDEDYTYNNIIAFSGERGIGKTSVMMSFAKMLENGYHFSNEKYTKIKIENNKNNISYNLARTIDPSLFNCNTNILEVVVSGMFSNFKEMLEERASCNQRGLENFEDKKQKTLKAFEIVFKDVKTTLTAKDKMYDNDPIEALLSFSSAFDLKKHMNTLVTEYLDFVGMDCLVIRIDDIDLHTNHAHSMVEEIRKYLTLEKVIILMALNVEQLEDVIHQQYLTDYKVLVASDQSRVHELRDTTTRYMEKLIPINRRIMLPTMRTMAYNAAVQIIDGEDHYYRSKLEDFIKELIYTKVGVVTFEEENKAYNLMPKNLREYVYLVEMLWSMKTVKITSFVKSLYIQKELSIGECPKFYGSIMGLHGVPKFISVEDVIISNVNDKDAIKDIIKKTHDSYYKLNDLLKVRGIFSESDKYEVDLEFVMEQIDKNILISEVKLKKMVIELDEDEIYHNCVKNDKEDKVIKDITKIKISQLDIFKGYFLNWIKDKLNEIDSNLIKELFEIV